MTYTKQHASENIAMHARAIEALREVGWTPHNEPRNWRDLGENATYLVLRQFPAEVEFKRARHQVLRVMAEYRGYKKAEWKE